jgi:hypothetical protein
MISEVRKDSRSVEHTTNGFLEVSLLTIHELIFYFMILYMSAHQRFQSMFF